MMPAGESPDSTAPDRYHVRSVERALSILKLFLTGEGELNLVEISARMHLPQSTAFRLLVTLRSSGLIEQSKDSGKYRLGATSLALGGAFLRSSDLRQSAKDSLEALRDRCGETVHLAVLDKLEVIYLDKLAGLHPIGLMSSRVGDRSPAHCTGLGKALLAQLTDAEIRERYASASLRRYTPNTVTHLGTLLKDLGEVRAQGYAIDDEEHEPGVACVAAPIFDSAGTAAALSVAGPSQRINEQLKSKELPRIVRQAAAEVSARLGGGEKAAAFLQRPRRSALTRFDS
jgi:DNA-binding IclR family transcriptional regulator